jgi:hypothetical protein
MDFNSGIMSYLQNCLQTKDMRQGMTLFVP